MRIKIPLENEEDAYSFLKIQEDFLEYLEKEYDVKIAARGNELFVRGTRSAAGEVKKKISEAMAEIRENGTLPPAPSEPFRKKPADLSVRDVQSVLPDRERSQSGIPSSALLITTRGKKIAPRTAGQKKYVERMKNHDMVFAIGPAGTGKTYLAVAMAVMYLKQQQVNRIILTRPAVEAGEKLGFLPGGIQEKVDPYFRPLYDALFDMLDAERFYRYLDRGVIEIAPLAFMRGRTLNDAFIILDEAQNTTYEQMKMFLTRLGFSSRVVITGDITQVDLPAGRDSGLTQVRQVLKEVEGIEFVYLSDEDVVRHELVQKIIQAYERHEQETIKGQGVKGTREQG